MDKEMTLRHLAQAEDEAALGEKHIAQQRAIVKELGRDGHTSAAERLLATFEESQIPHVEHLDRLRKEPSRDADS